MIRALALALALAGCGKSGSQCRAEADAFARLFEGVDVNVAGPVWETEAALVERADLGPTDAWPAVIVTLLPGKLAFGDDATPVTAVELKDKLGAARDDFDKPRYGLFLLIDAAVPWSEVVAAVGLATEAGWQKLAFTFAIPRQGTPPPRAPIDDELDAIMRDPPGDRATRFAKLVERVTADCGALHELFGAIGSIEGGKTKAEILRDGIPEALIECKCDAPIADLQAAMWRLLTVPQPMRSIVFDPEAPAERLELPAATRWSEASKRFAPGLRNAALVVR